MIKRKLRTLLLVVNTHDTNLLFEEIGVEYIAAYLRKQDYEVMLMAEGEDRIDYNKIKDFFPDIIGMPVYASSEAAVCRVSKKLKEVLPGLFICIGGYSATSRGKNLMKECEEIDFCIRGEGELVWHKLLECLQRGEELRAVRGLTYRNEACIIENEEQELIPDLDTLPMPARDLLAEKKYKIAVISSSRGCTGNCSFCLVRMCWKRWRGRSPKLVVDEMEYVKNTYGVSVFHFIDCSFEDPGICHDRVKEIAAEIVKRKLEVFYIAFFRAEFHRNADEEMMQLLKASGLCGAMIGIEAANAFDLKLYNKKAALEDNDKILELFKKYDIHTEIGFIMLNPYSTFENIRQNLEYLERNNLMCITNAYRMYEGSSLKEKLRADGLLAADDENNEHGYVFADKRIMDLAKYIKEFCEKTCTATIKLHNSVTLLAYWKRIYEKNDNIHKEIAKHEAYCNELIKDFNERMFKWFKAVLETAERDWDENKANHAAEQLVGEDYLNELITKLESKRSVLNIRLYRLGLDISKAPFV